MVTPMNKRRLEKLSLRAIIKVPLIYFCKAGIHIVPSR